MKMALEGLNPQDTFNLITFAGDTAVLFEKPVSATPENLKKAWTFMESRQGGGGTEMMKAIRTALDPSDSQQHVRIVCFMTDGYVGNEAEILSEIQKHQNARIFSFGIGSSVNRFLLDKMAEEGRGEVEYVSLSDDGSAAAKRFHERVRNPLLTDISLDFGNLKVADVYPQKINDLFSAKPVVIHGRFTNAGSGVIKLKGKSFGREIVREIPVNLPENEPLHDVLATLWARTRIDDLTKQDYQNTKPEIKEQITSLGIEYRLMTQFTSFVAVEERVVTDGGQPRKIEVPVELPEGVSREGIFGVNDDEYEKFDRKAIGRGTGAYLPMPTVAVAKTKVRPNKGILKEERPKNIAIDKDISILSGEEQNEVRIGLKAKVLPKAVYPAAAKIDSVVKVELTLDARGNVLSAKAISGDKSFFETTEIATKTAKFTIPQTSREIKKITGVIIFDFKAKTKSVMVSDTLQNLKVEVKPNKYQSSVKALVERLNGKQALTAEDLKFVKDGKAEIIVRVSDLNAQNVNALKAAGFEVLTEMASSNAVVGKIAVEKLAALAELDAVTFISAQNR